MNSEFHKQKKIIMLSQTVFPPDIRLEKEIRSLKEKNYFVYVICNQFEKGKDPDFSFCSIIRIKAFFKSIKINKIINFPFFLSPRILFTVFYNAWKIKPDIIHAHDLPMAPIGVFLKYVFRVPLILDFHENYPEALKYFKKSGLINYIFKNPNFAAKLEKICVKFADRIIVVINENKENLINAAVSAEKIEVVSNTVDLKTFAIEEPNYDIMQKYKNHFVILYTGNVSPERGLDTAVKAVKYLKDRILNIKMVIVGDGPSVRHLKKLSKDENVSDYIEFIQWPGHDKLSSYLKSAKICMIPQPSNSFIDTTIPHKLFEYMSQAIPVITSDAKPFKRILSETKAGTFFKSNNEEDFAQRIIEFNGSKEPFGENGKEAVLETYNWNKEAEVLLNMYSQLIS